MSNVIAFPRAPSVVAAVAIAIAIAIAIVIAGVVLGTRKFRSFRMRIRELERRARIANATTSVVIVTDVEGVIVWVNDAFTRVTEFSAAEAVGRTPGQLLQGPETDRTTAARVGAALRARQKVAAELINYGKSGRKYWIGMKIEPLLDQAGVVEGFIAIEADITERHEQRLALDLLTSRFNLATRAGHVGVFDRPWDEQNIWWNDMMYEITGRDPATFKPTFDAWLSMIHEDDRERVRNGVGSKLKPRSSPAIRYRIVRPDGGTVHVESIGSGAGRSQGSAGHSAGIVLDISDRVAAEARESALQHQLREASHHAGMAEIATGVLHNVGNVLNSLGIANTTARRDLKAIRLDRLAQAASLIQGQRATLADFLTNDARGRHMPDYLAALSAQLSTNMEAVNAEMATIDQLLNHLRDIVNAQQALARSGGLRETLDLQRVAEAALLVHAAELAHIDVVRFYGELPPVMTDRHQVLQILVNLVSNARDAIQAGDTLPRRLAVRLSREGDDAVISVEDSGVGMSEEVLSRLWRFGYTTKPDGHGFGLHNSANAARALGGSITAHSDGIGKGSRFTLRLPIACDPQLRHGMVA